ncbi:MAG: hypothetical protein KBA06_01990 [Saprospiraceae bacterium]|nr:hypothetical protein [Saprospiraceae bacterium]
MILRIKPILPIIIIAALFSSCASEAPVDAEVCFDDQVLPIFVSHCTESGCHNASDREKGLDLTNYESIISKGITPGDYKSSEIYQSLVTNMPPDGRMSNEQIETIALWIEQGANHTTCAETSCDTTSVSYSADILPIVNTYCVGCHSGSSPSGEISYETYAEVKSSVFNNGQFLGSIRHDVGYSEMPKDASQLSNCKIAKIQKWINDGAPNN